MPSEYIEIVLCVDENFFIACSHQSMFETFFLQTLFVSPVFILKKELLKIPIFGLYLKKIGSISINRNKTVKEKKRISSNKPSVPEKIYNVIDRGMPR